MARLTDSEGRMLGGLHLTPNELFLVELFPPLTEASTSEQAAVSPPHLTQFGPDEVVTELECDYGAFAYLSYSSGIANPASGVLRPISYTRDCVRVIDQPTDRHYCPACHGYYCATHAKPNAHDCAAIIVTQPRAA